MSWVAAVVLLALIEYMVFGMLVGRARSRYGIAAPAVNGHEMFERYFRVHQNTLEQLIVFVPAAWMFGVYLSAGWAAGIGMIFVIGRILYAVGYVRDPARRELGAGLSFLPTIVLIIGAVIGLVRDLAGA